MKRFLLFLLIICFRQSHAQEMLGLVAGWKMDNTCELTDILTTSPVNGVLVDISSATNKFNEPQSAYSFNSSTSYITVGAVDKLKLENDKSISFLIRPVLTGSNHTGSVFSYGSAINIRYVEQSGTPKLNVIFGNTLYMQVNLTADQWQAVTITFEKNFSGTKSKAIAYVGGVFNSESEQNKSAHTFDNAIAVIGAQDQNTLTNGFRGVLDELRIFNRTLTAVEALNLALPVTLEYFRGKRANGQVVLSWKTSEEKNTTHFEVEKSRDGKQFQLLTTVKSGKFSYSITDILEAGETDLWYRLKVVDADGKFTYSPVVRVGDARQPAMWQLYPNPASRTLYFSGTSGVGKITIINSTGMVLRGIRTAGNGVDVSSLAPGIYLLRFDDGDTVFTSKFIKQ